MAKLSDSVPPLVKTISDGSAPMSAATRRPRVVDRGLGLLAEVVDARRVAEQVARRGGDGVGHLRSERGRRVVVEVDTHR